MKKLLFILTLGFSVLSWSQEYSRAKIITGSEGLLKLANLGLSVDHGTIKREAFIISDFSAQEIQIAKDNGFEVEILIADVQAFYVNQNKTTSTSEEKNVGCVNQGGSTDFVPSVPTNFNLGTMGGFYTYQEFIDEIDAMRTQFPTLITAKAPISTFVTHESRPIYFMKISDNPDSDETEPEVLYSSIHHAREPNSLAETIFYMWYMLENYSTDLEVKYLVDNTEMYFVPMVNPDGYIRNQTTNPTGGGMWRKNRRNIGGGVYGVDLNRNYSYQWGTTGVSFTTSSDTYPGTAAFSEPETQAMKWLCENRDFRYAFNAHTFASSILFPIGTTTAEFAEDHDYLQAFTDHMVQYNGYTAMKSSGLYPASGDSDDYMYKVDTIIKPKIFAMTPEVSNDAGGFWPATSEITPNCQEMVFPNMILAHLTHKYYVVKDSDPSTVNTLTGNFSHSANRLGIENGSVSVSITPILNIQTIGAPFLHDLGLNTIANGTISYTLSPTIVYGDLIKYVINTDNGLWVKHDTIVKTYGSVSSQFTDNASNTTNWSGTWGLSVTQFVSPSTSFTDSPTANYTNNLTKTYTYNNSVNLTNVTAAAVNYYAKWDIEADYDYVQLQVSIDGGTNWIGQCTPHTNEGTSANGSVQPDGQPVYDGTQSSWIFEEVNLSDYIGETINLRFILKSDGGSTGDGFYFDDFELLYNIDYTSIEENTPIATRIFPNPTENLAYLNLDKSVKNATIQIVNQNGQVVSTLQQVNESNKITLPTETLTSGVYFVKVIAAGMNFETEKLVILK